MRLRRGAAASGRRCSGAGMLLGADAAGRRCGCWLLLQRGGPSAPHSSVPLSAALRKETDGENQGSLPNPLFVLSPSPSHTSPFVLPLPSPQPTSSSLYGPSQSPHPPTSPFPSSATSSSFPKTLMHLYRVRRSEKSCSRQAQETMQTLHVRHQVPCAKPVPCVLSATTMIPAYVLR